MDGFTEKQVNTLNNFKEHLSVIKQDIEEYNALREVAQKNYKEELLKLEKLRKEREEFNAVSDKERENYRAARLIAKDELKRLSKQIAEQKARSEKQIEEHKKLAASVIAGLDNQIITKREILNDLIANVSSSRETLLILENKIKELTVICENLSSDRKSLESLLHQMAEELSALRETYKNESNYYKSLISQYEKKTQEEKDRISIPLKLLREGQAELERKIKNFQIIQRRFERIYKDKLPNQTLRI